MRLHDDEVVSTPALVRRLIADQFPQWAHLLVTPGPAGGTDHHLFRLGAGLLVRMPKVAWAEHQAASDARWLPVLAPHLPLQVPAPEAVGEPGHGFPFCWSVTPWLDGASPAVGELGTDAARQLGELVVALRAVSTAGAPVKDGTSRGVPLARLDDAVRAAVAACGDRIDGPAATKMWEQALDARPATDGHWIHGDLLPGNLLADGGRLTAVIDWGATGVGDPAADLIPAWTQFTGQDRAVFRATATDGLPDPDDAWERARGWVLVQGVLAIPYYWERWPTFARACRDQVAAVLAG